MCYIHNTKINRSWPEVWPKGIEVLELPDGGVRVRLGKRPGRYDDVLLAMITSRVYQTVPNFDEIIELAAIPMIGIEIGDGEAFYAEIRPERNIPAETKAVHGLHGRELSNAPVLTDVLPQLAKMMHGRIVVAHNVAVDFDFIRTKARIAGFAPPERPLLDTAEIARVLFPERNRLGLDEIVTPQHPDFRVRIPDQVQVIIGVIG